MTRTVCVIDTGIAVDAVPTEAVVSGINLSGVGGSEDLTDADSRHGGLVAATILSEMPSAGLAVIRLLDRDGWLREPARLDAAFDWIDRQRDVLGITVVCAAFADMSHLRTDDAFRDTPVRRHIAALRARGVATVAPAGNWYPAFRLAQPQGMAWPAIVREVVSVGAIDARAVDPALHPFSQRLHATVGTGCRTTVFAMPSLLGETSGAAAVVAGRLAAIRLRRPAASVDELVAHLLAGGRTIRDETGLSWPAIDSP